MLNSMTVLVDSAATRWASWMLAASLDSAVLLALVGASWLAIRRHVSPQVGYGLFLLVPLKLLVPVFVEAPAGLARWTPSALVASRFNDAPATVAPSDARITSPSSLVERPVTPASAEAPEFREVPAKPSARTEGAEPAIDGPATAPSLAIPSPSLPVILMAAWLIGVLFLAVRFAREQARFRRAFRGLTPLEESGLGVDLKELCERAGVRGGVRLREGDGVKAPSVCGVFRPTILLPRGFAASFSAQQLRWVLLHELAHVRRRDLIVVALQRVAAIVHFFNPTIWVANRMLNQLREYRCDDVALAQGDGCPVESGEAFVRILRIAGRSRGALDGGLGVFGLDARSSTLRRARRLLDVDRPLRVRFGPLPIAALVLLAIVVVPYLRASGDPRQPAPTTEDGRWPGVIWRSQATTMMVASAPRSRTSDEPPQAAPAKEKSEVVVMAVTTSLSTPAGDQPRQTAPPADGREGRDFELTVLGPDGKPIPEAEVQLRMNPRSPADRIRRGTFVKEQRYDLFVKADAEGRVALELPAKVERFDVFVDIPNYGPFWAGWRRAEAIPPRLTASLDRAWIVGGVIVDAAGKPIEGASVRPSVQYKTSPDNPAVVLLGQTVTTDATGAWRFDKVPGGLNEVHVEINHPNYRPNRPSLTWARFGLAPGVKPTAAITLDAGLSVTGKITDEAGAPIADALVRTKFLNDIREARTGADGAYTLLGCEFGAARIVASARGRAIDMKEVDIAPGMAPVDFAMKPGRTVRIRVLNAQGEPIPRTRIFFQRWRGPFQYFEFDHVGQRADENGVWVWHEAPVDEFQADVCPPNGVQMLLQPFIARDEEYVVRAPAPLAITGRVTDATTGKPIPRFRVVPGIRSTPDHMNWDRNSSFEATDGRFEYLPDRGYLAHLLLIEADGYQLAVSREIKSDEGSVVVDFKMGRGTDLSAEVKTASGEPAAGARIALGVAGSQINIKNGDVDDGMTYAARAVTDAAGRFQFPPPNGAFQLVIAHPAGFAHITATSAWEPSRVIKLEPWCRVEGTFQVGGKPVEGAPITINASRPHSYGPEVPSIFTHYDATTGPGGRFVFDRVIPGEGSIGRRIMLTVNEGSVEPTSSCMVPMRFPENETIRVALGGTGRAVAGRLEPPEGLEKGVRWNFAILHASPSRPENAARGPFLSATVDGEGRFRIDDAPPGEYRLRVEVSRAPRMRLLDVPFTVPPPTVGDPKQPVDLGSLRLQKL
ncbi:carboxypeptidase regulatory-like domain-containing protein [Paludisphaera rhizosphaerae]|uniref:carboxypeptidase regulatory-like domain-containing protein n=1 Tax=Paludisphaera rhizosphaerae TaxID=2711216 RepID=UPI0013EC0EA0|nr:carboxypeptidase regulatory-like domain-containing protein [Paludisphaera rhizosphaerae]